jgi:hypothetical protein
MMSQSLKYTHKNKVVNNVQPISSELFALPAVTAVSRERREVTQKRNFFHNRITALNCRRAAEARVPWGYALIKRHKASLRSGGCTPGSAESGRGARKAALGIGRRLGAEQSAVAEIAVDRGRGGASGGYGKCFQLLCQEHDEILWVATHAFSALLQLCQMLINAMFAILAASLKARDPVHLAFFFII